MKAVSVFLCKLFVRVEAKEDVLIPVVTYFNSHMSRL